MKWWGDDGGARCMVAVFDNLITHQKTVHNPIIFVWQIKNWLRPASFSSNTLFFPLNGRNGICKGNIHLHVFVLHMQRRSFCITLSVIFSVPFIHSVYIPFHCNPHSPMGGFSSDFICFHFQSLIGPINERVIVLSYR